MAVADPRAELLSAVHEELDRLPEHYRAAIVLCDLGGLDLRGDTRRLGCPIGTVGSRLNRGREKLRDRLVRRGLAPAAGVVAGSLSDDAFSAAVPPALAADTVSSALGLAAGLVEAIPAAAAEIIRHLTRSLAMTRFRTIAATVAAAGAFLAIPALTYRAFAGPQPPAVGAKTPSEATSKMSSQRRKTWRRPSS